jgi:hypothetical protein
MKNTFLKISLFILTLITLNACQEVIDIDLNTTNSQYVITGGISNDYSPCVIKIAKTANFSDTNNFPTVTGAVVTLKDDSGDTETLLETTPGTYQTKNTIGKAGHTYTLTVKHDGKIFTSVSKMANENPLISVQFLKNNFGAPPGSTDTLPTFTCVPIHTDEPNIKNFYRYIQTINGVQDKTFLIRNDVFNDGKLNAQPIFSRAIVHAGDTYHLKMENIDENVYTYFFSLNQSSGNGPGGGTTPTNPPNNISGGALGYFSVYSVTEIKTVVK